MSEFDPPKGRTAEQRVADTQLIVGFLASQQEQPAPIPHTADEWLEELRGM